MGGDRLRSTRDRVLGRSGACTMASPSCPKRRQREQQRLVSAAASLTMMPSGLTPPSSEAISDSTAAKNRIRSGDRVLLSLEDGNTFLVRMRPGASHSTHRGVIAHDCVIGAPWGTILSTTTGSKLYALRPGWTDSMMKVHRRTNIMYPKDVGYLLAELAVGPGARVVEIGCGSGAMTIALARAVHPGGEIYTYDRRPEFLRLAAANCSEAGFEEAIRFRHREPDEALEADTDVFFCDVPEPWLEVPEAYASLRGSGRFGAATPTYNQAERLAAALIGGGFAMTKTVEVLVRHILARPGRTRPAHRMIGHTQLLTTAIKVVPMQENGVTS